MLYANTKCADQTAHMRSLISTFVIRNLDNVIGMLLMSNILGLWKVFVAEQTNRIPICS